MENENSSSVATPVAGEEKRFTQEEVNAMMSQERRKAEADRENLRQQAIQEVNRAKGVTSTIQQILEQDRAREAAEAIEKEQVSRYFGSKASGKLAQELHSQDKNAYAAMRERAVFYGFLGNDARPVTGTSRRGFNPTN